MRSHIIGQEKYHNLSIQVRHLNSGNSFTIGSCWDALSAPEQNSQCTGQSQRILNGLHFWIRSIFGAHQMNCAQYLQSSYHVNSDSERFSFKYTKSCNPLNLHFLSRNNLRDTLCQRGTNKKVFCYIKNLRNMSWNFCIDRVC